MRKTLFLIILFSATLSGVSQKAMTFNIAREQNIRNSWLDSTYTNGINTDTSKAVFKSNVDEYIAAYQQLLQELVSYLKSNGLVWEKPIRGFNKIYFDKSGKIDYYLYNLKPDQLTSDQEKTFDALLKKFVASHTFSLKAPVNFAQCSPVTYMPPSK